ncbi:MAG: GNAT family N-acetyltransferase [Actinomycetota bacterium]
MSPTVRPLRDEERAWVRDFVRERWGDEIVVGHGVVFTPATLPGLVLTDDAGGAVGLLTYVIEKDACEVVTIDAVVEGCGYGGLLIESVAHVAREAGCSLWLITTNDNVRAIGFYRAHGFEVVAIREDAIQESRRLKASIPLVNELGVPIRDEIEMERRLSFDAGNLPT